MRSIDYLDAVKKKLAISSNYALSKALEIERQMVNAYYRGERVPDAYACTRIAVLLEIDPALVIAEIQAENEKNEKKRQFWQGFASRAGKLTVVIAVSISMLSSVDDATAKNGGADEPELTKSQIIRTRVRLRRIFRALAAFFSCLMGRTTSDPI